MLFTFVKVKRTSSNLKQAQTCQCCHLIEHKSQEMLCLEQDKMYFCQFVNSQILREFSLSARLSFGVYL